MKVSGSRVCIILDKLSRKATLKRHSWIEARLMSILREHSSEQRVSQIRKKIYRFAEELEG